MNWLIFALGALLAWGAYGPALHGGQAGFTGFAREVQSLKAILCVGVAYFFVAVVVPAIILSTKGQLAGFPMKGAAYSTLSGVLGAVGAICIAWAFKEGGKPLIVMPLVFGGAPVVNAIISTISHPPEGGLKSVNPLLYVGLVMVAAGAAMVLKFKPA